MWSSIYRNPASSKLHGRSYVCQESESCNSESGFAQTTKMVDAPSAVGTPKLGFSWRSWDRWGRIWQPGSWEALWPLHHWNMSCILQPILQPLEDRGRFITDPLGFEMMMNHFLSSLSELSDGLLIPWVPPVGLSSDSRVPNSVRAEDAETTEAPSSVRSKQAADTEASGAGYTMGSGDMDCNSEPGTVKLC